jgi:glycosyltransferase involved in cell wall biosynthesis
VKISIITVTYNSAKTINETFASVTEQDYPFIEYIVVDGGSRDGTLDLIQDNSANISKWISEPDSGLYDAMNKGIRMAKGDVIGLINSDDFYIDNRVISDVVATFHRQELDAVHGELFYVDAENTDKVVRHWKTGEFIKGSFANGWHPAHPTLFLKRSVYEKYGLFNLDFKLAADFEFMCRIFEKYTISSAYLNRPLIKMRLGGATSKNLRNILAQNLECYRAFTTNGVAVSPFYTFKRILPKLKQYL